VIWFYFGPHLWLAPLVVCTLVLWAGLTVFLVRLVRKTAGDRAEPGDEFERVRRVQET
jgi:hypothetical protein